ncbi:uncharacterized protein LOC115622892 isoform X3 [Scaptodrosophila lebanonensis]|uniref:Uncharacterized protein LOC115622892 isoform X3 n=1 Tax=Drosophila lebanonensis TaxID=7225 RepID=A0A6J2T7E8_DROLE|nr:uncharacterized protein LOC115622892 isoform X3 [Scaptodrosophila lebanonensis]
MGKCVSRQPTTAAHHQSVLTITLSEQDLAQTHKLWQQLTSSNEYVAATESTVDPQDEPFYYCISHKKPKREAADNESEALLHFETIYNNVLAAEGPNDYTCQEFLLQELAQFMEQADVVSLSSLAKPEQEPEQWTVDCGQRINRPAELQLKRRPTGCLGNAKEGQTESKKQGGGGGKASRRNNGEQGEHTLHTKGTAMSFGFRKKLNSTPKKFKKLLEGTTDRGGDGDSKTPEPIKDDNGNAATPPPVHFEKVGAAAQRGATGAAGNRFGYRGQMPRPASTGLATMTGEESTTENNNNNNHNGNATASNTNNNPNNNNNNNAGVLVSNLKRRSKSAHAGRTLDGTQSDGEPKITQPKTLTFNLNQNTTIEYQRRQFFGEIVDGTSQTTRCGSRSQQTTAQRYNYNNLASMHANVIVRPTPRAAPASFAKFTLQTVSLPRPEYPVAISLSATTPTTPSSSSVQSPIPAHATGARAKDTTTSTTTTTTRQHPLTSVHAQPIGGNLRQLDQKSVKQLTNNSTRRGFSGSREISADSGIASMDMALDSSGSCSSGATRRTSVASPKRSRSRPRNLQMVMSGRHTFEVRDLDDPPSSESSSFVETLALPKLPTDSNQSMPLPLVGLVRSNTVLSRESYERRQGEQQQHQDQQIQQKPTNQAMAALQRNGSDESESVDEEKLYLDSSTSEKSAKQQNTSPCSSTLSSWCQAGESLAVKDCSSMSITSSSDGNNQHRNQANKEQIEQEQDMSLGLDDISLMNTDMQFSTLSSITETPKATAQPQDSLLKMHIVDNREGSTLETQGTNASQQCERPRSFNNALNESKFAELALASSNYLLDDETSPTDSLVSSTESEEAVGKLQKHKLNAELQEKDIDEISPELEVGSPISPGTPTHASHSLSLGSDCGNLIDDEIADQPALLFNSDAQEPASGELSLAQQTDTPTLMETHTHTGSLRSLKSQSKARTALQQAIELSLRTPASIRKAVMERAESLDTLSPCESICSDDLMMDFDVNSSMDSIDHTTSVRSRSGSDLHQMEQSETELMAQLERKSSNVMQELNSMLRQRMQRNGARERISAHLPARATRLLNRSRLQDQQLQQCANNANDSDNSLRSTQSGGGGGGSGGFGGAARKRNTQHSRPSTASSTSSLQRRQRQQQQQPAAGSSSSRCSQRHLELHSSSDDLMLYDKSFRNAMIQDVLQFKKQLLRLRRILQETETLNPFEHDNVQLFAACGLDSKQLNDIDLASLTSSTTEDPLQELSDLRRQGQVDDRDRTIRLQRDLIEQLEAEKRQACVPGDGELAKELISMATQTERTRPLAIGAEGLSRSKPEYTSYTTHFPTLHCNDSTVAATTIIRHQQQQQHHPCNSNNSNTNCQALNQTRRHTIISTTLTNYNQQLATNMPRRASIAWDPAEVATATAAATRKAAAAAATPTPAYKPVRITLIGEPLPPQNGYHKVQPTQQQQQQQQNGLKTRYSNGGSCHSVKKASSNGQTQHYQPLYNSNKMTNPTVTIV